MPPVRAGVTWVRALRGWRADALLAGLVAAEGAVEIAVLAGDPAQAALAALGLAMIAAAVLVRRRWPAVAPAAGFLGVSVLEHAGDGLAMKAVGPFFTMGLLTWSLGRHAEDRAVPWGLAGALATMVVALAVDPTSGDSVASNLAFGGIVVVGLPFIAGRAARNRSRLNAALRAKRAAAEHDRERRAEEAVLDERTRIAGELHDVVAHALSAMTIQASAARRLAAGGDGQAGDAFAAVEHTGREALGELRRLLGVLRREDEELALAPQPSLANLESLARRTTASGLPVELRVDGTPGGPVPVGVDLTAYRLVQAALHAARDDGAAGRAEVRLRYGDGAVVVEVRDDGHGGAPRTPLGMRERVEVYGGSIDAVAAEGSHRLRARFPVGAPA